MDKGQIEKELNDLFEKTKKLVDDAYICGYRDGYYECMIHKYRAKEEDPKITDVIQVLI